VGTVGMSCWRTSILQPSAAILSISVAFARTTMTYHSPPVMVAIGLLGDEADRNQLDARRRPSAVGGLPMPSGTLLTLSTLGIRDIEPGSWGGAGCLLLGGIH